METDAPFRHSGLSGGITLKLKQNLTLNDICIRFVPAYEPDRFEPIALRLFYGREIIMTIYALDKSKQEGNNYDPATLPVKKFKLENISVNQLSQFVEEINFTVNTGDHKVEDIEVENR
jgi:hypothetical protein